MDIINPYYKPANEFNINNFIGAKKQYVVKDPNYNIKIGIWVYFILLIFEGALRKWILPGLATPLLLIRDPIAIWLLVVTLKKGVLKFNFYLIAVYIIAIIAIYTALFLGHGSLLVALFGARALLIHFPMIFIVASVFDRNDIIKIGRFMIWVTIPMTILIMLQFYSPQSAWVNRGIGGDTAGGGFSGALGFFRPSATFSFTNGTAHFYNLSACFIFYFWLVPQKYISRQLLILASIMLLIAIPLSISRSLFFSVIVTLIFVLIAISRNPKYAGKIIITLVALLCVLVVLSQLSFFQKATEVFTARFTGANETEGGLKGVLGDRYLGGMISAFDASSKIPFFGYGIGMGTNVGSVLLTGKSQFLIAEGEWARLIGELGFIMGLAIIVIRLALSIKVTVGSYKRLSEGDFLPWIILSFCLLIFPQGLWSQPTSLGFSILAVGFTMASFNLHRANEGK